MTMVVMTVVMIKQYATVTRLSLSSKLGRGGAETVLPLLGVGVGGGELMTDFVSVDTVCFHVGCFSLIVKCMRLGLT